MTAVALVSHTNENDMKLCFKSKLNLPLADVNREVTIYYGDSWNGIIYSVLTDKREN